MFPKAPQFFKIILPQTISDGKLRIPPAFVRKHGGAIPNWVTLKVPSGEAWGVKLSKNGNDLFFEKGWKDFSDHFCLEFGHFLVFQYKGNGIFDVVVFNRSATEIHYPHIEDLDSDQETENTTRSITVSKRSDSDQESEDTTQSITVSKRSDGIHFPSMANEKIKDETSKLSKTCLDSLGFTSNSNSSDLCFEIAVRPFTLRNGYVVVPTSFVKKCVMVKNPQSVTLVSDGKSWTVKSIRNGSSANLSAGWPAFHKGNHLRDGDVCMFELIKTSGDDIVLKVTVSKSGI